MDAATARWGAEMRNKPTKATVNPRLRVLRSNPVLLVPIAARQT
jgi:hypothetical protein